MISISEPRARYLRELGRIAITMSSMSGLIDSHHEMILSRWRSCAARAPFAVGLSLSELDGMMPRYLHSLGGGDRDVAVALSVEQQALIEQHLADRIRARDPRSTRS